MKTYNEEVGNKLNSLLEKTYDAEKGFTKASENVKMISLKSYFEKKALQRNGFGHQLKAEIKSYGQDVEKGGSVTGTAHRTWMDIKSLLSIDNEESMLEEAIRGEKAAVDEYEDILKHTDLPLSTLRLLSTQKESIESGLTRIKKLEDIA